MVHNLGYKSSYFEEKAYFYVKKHIYIAYFLGEKSEMLIFASVFKGGKFDFSGLTNNYPG